MKKMLSLAAMFAALSYASPAFAETNINVYGTLDAAVGDVTHSLSVDPNFPGSVNPVTPVKKTVPNAVIGIFNGGISDSRIGVKGTTDICDGMKVFYTLEEGFNLPTGKVNDASAYLVNNSGPNGATTAGAASSLSGQLFNRQAFVGISDKDLGSLAVGRNYAPIFDIAVNNEFVDITVDTIIQSASHGAGEIGDGKIFITPLEECVRIRTRERGGKAI